MGEEAGKIIGAVVSSVQKRLKEWEPSEFRPRVQRFLDTGSYALNWAISGRPRTGGWPGGRVMDIYGDPSTGKSLLLYHALGVATRSGGFGILDDTENCYMKDYGAVLGVDNSRLIPLESETVEEHFEAVRELRRELRAKIGPEPWIVIALDSLANLMTGREQSNEFQKPDHGWRAQLVKKCMKLLRPDLSRDDGTIYMVANHVIANIGDPFNPTTTPGGGGVPFSASVRVELQTRGKTKEGAKVIGVDSRALVSKNKIFPPFRECRLHVRFDRGVVREYDLFEAAKTEGVAADSGSKGWYVMEGVEAKFQSKKFYEELLDKALDLMESRRVSEDTTTEEGEEKE